MHDGEKEKPVVGESMFRNLVTSGLRFRWSRVEKILFQVFLQSDRTTPQTHAIHVHT